MLRPRGKESSFGADIALPPGSTQLSLQAIDKAGNIGPPATVAVP
jgi:hypothetical protein